MLIKERKGDICIIREDNYGKTLAKINRMVAIAKADLPTINDDLIQVVVYGGERYKGTLGIECHVMDGSPIPADYVEVASLEWTLL